MTILDQQTTSNNTLWFIVPAAGVGQRMGADCPKQYLPLADTTIIQQTLGTLLSLPFLAGIVVAIHADDQFWSQSALSTHKKIHTVIGGDKRSDSVLAALQSLQGKIGDNDWVLVHDAARPCVDPNSIQQLIDDLVDHAVGGILGVPSNDTLKKVDQQSAIEETLDRDVIWQAQTPQMFRYGILCEALLMGKNLSAKNEQWPMTDEASAVERLGYSVKMVLGRHDNIKVTQADDLWLAEAILARRKIVSNK
ncbi:MAG: 2-C-methyl-D-erythritol 4-phosphate cytidylyltransferase [Kiritimatiellia bacterium]|jgi:2-C-methyl-D-erythritol 4-phosphate cytidylyltransferase